MVWFQVLFLLEAVTHPRNLHVLHLIIHTASVLKRAERIQEQTHPQLHQRSHLYQRESHITKINSEPIVRSSPATAPTTRTLIPGCIKHREQNKPKVQTKCHRLLFCFGHNATRAGCLGLRSAAATQPPQGHGRFRRGARRRGARAWRPGCRGSGAGRKAECKSL